MFAQLIADVQAIFKLKIYTNKILNKTQDTNVLILNVKVSGLVQLLLKYIVK